MKRLQSPPVVYVQTYPIIIIDVSSEAKILPPKAQQLTPTKTLLVSNDK